LHRPDRLDIESFFLGDQAQGDLRAVDIRPPGSRAVAEHLAGHRLPLAGFVALAVFTAPPAFFAGQLQGDRFALEHFCCCLVGGYRTAAGGGIRVVKDKAQGRKAAAGINRGDQELAAPGRPAMDRRHVLHHH
jgi:hypothetical protein